MIRRISCILLLALCPLTPAARNTPRNESQILQEIKTSGETAALRAELGRLYLNRGKNDEAVREFEKASRIDPAHPETAYGISAAAFRKGDFLRAEEYALLASGLRPLDSYYLTHLARVRMELKKFDQAAEALNRAIAIRGKQTAGQYALLALCREKQGRFREAAELTLKQLESRPWDDTIYVEAARMFFRAGDNASGNRYKRMAGHAWDEFDYLKGLQNENNLAWSLFRSQRYAEAREIFLKLWARAPEGKPALLWAAGLCSLRLDQDTTAEEFFWSCLEKDRTFGRAWNGLGQVALVRGDLMMAKKFFLEAIKSDPGDTFALNDLAELYITLKDWPAALATAKKLNEADPENGYLWARTARMAERVNEPVTAWQSWLRAFQNSRSRKDRQQNLRKAVEAGYKACAADPARMRSIAETMIKYLPPENEDHVIYKKMLSGR